MNALWTSMWYWSSWSRDGLRLNQLCGRLKNRCTNINKGTFAIKDLTANGSSSRNLPDGISSSIWFDATGKLSATDREQRGKCEASNIRAVICSAHRGLLL